jgi:hypothetical protein
MLMTESAESNLLTLVKTWSTWVITSKISSTIPNDPLDQVNTHFWSNLGQRHGQTPLKKLMSLNVLLKDRLGDQRGGSEWEPIKILLEGD